MDRRALHILTCAVLVSVVFVCGCSSSDRPNGKVVDGVRTFSLAGENFKFTMDGVDNPELRVKKGETIRIEFTTVDSYHNWAIDEFDAATEKMQTGGTSSVTFVADTAGTFEYYCAVGAHRQNNMTGRFVVLE